MKKLFSGKGNGMTSMLQKVKGYLSDQKKTSEEDELIGGRMNAESAVGMEGYGQFYAQQLNHAVSQYTKEQQKVMQELERFEQKCRRF